MTLHVHFPRQLTGVPLGLIPTTILIDLLYQTSMDMHTIMHASSNGTCCTLMGLVLKILRSVNGCSTAPMCLLASHDTPHTTIIIKPSTCISNSMMRISMRTLVS